LRSQAPGVDHRARNRAVDREETAVGRTSKRAKTSAKVKDLTARVDRVAASRVTGGCQNNLLPAVQRTDVRSITDGTSNTFA
jgi:hypothetical protein